MSRRNDSNPPITVTNEVSINHYELGIEVWEWDAAQQAAFLVGFAESFKADAGSGLLQFHYIAEELNKEPHDISAAQWLAEHLSAYLADPS